MRPLLRSYSFFSDTCVVAIWSSMRRARNSSMLVAITVPTTANTASASAPRPSASRVSRRVRFHRERNVTPRLSAARTRRRGR
ncbi:hypothetical protein K7G98_19945, partial [Saccharothrix sp. MB29]|nr:hypothetical protein [Saccharothrix sp. MB29]